MSHSSSPDAPAPGMRVQTQKVVITDSASAALEKAGVEGVFLLARHLRGDWGDVTDRDALQNELALLLGLRVLSRYALGDGAVIWIITEADRTITTIMLPDGFQGEGQSAAN